MSDHDHNPILGLYGTPGAAIRSRISERAKAMPPSPEQDDPAKIGNSIVSLTCLKDQKQTSR
ncbi:hypothetical protein CHY08_22510 (plasmid) [Rhizobium leguminosarum bv. viciae]|uniref:hypothetical protein n=1 Tax=Rhizobium leguminosarum TaxID=384 RepID=UPI000B8C70C2|nr:hypothetical protein [Rhizobium leguminosarum]ASR09898.1 hypothetical protein CHY08_22510 [Rhizobium leguminosarum bv. viciae]